MKGPLSMLARLLGHLGKGRRGECVQLCTSGITEEGGEAAGVSAPMGHTHMEAFRVSLKADLRMRIWVQVCYLGVVLGCKNERIGQIRQKKPREDVLMSRS